MREFLKRFLGRGTRGGEENPPAEDKGAQPQSDGVSSSAGPAGPSAFPSRFAQAGGHSELDVAAPASPPSPAPAPRRPQRAAMPPHPFHWPDGRADGSMVVLAGMYRLLGELGVGGFGEVYLAHDQVTGRQVAVKIPYYRGVEDSREGLAKWRNNPGSRKLLLDEVRRWIGLVHPHIVATFDVQDDETTDYIPAIVMECCEGGSLADRLHGSNHPAWPELLDIAIQVCWAMGYAHQQGLLHRDLKPANVLLTGEGVAKVSDFGLAKALAEGGVDLTEAAGSGTVQASCLAGTPSYMAPEVWQGQVGPASDVYAFGVMLYETFTGGHPFSGRDTETVRRQHLEASPRPPSEVAPGLPRELEELILACLSKVPADRRAGFDALADRLAVCYRVLTGESYGRSRPDESELSREQKLSKAWVLIRLGGGCQSRGDLQEAMAQYQDAQRIFETEGDREGLAACLGNQGIVLQTRCRMAEAMELFKQQETIWRELGIRKGLSGCLGNQGIILHTMGRLKEAMELHKQSEAICREMNGPAGLWRSLGNQANILADWGRLEEAMVLLKQQETICHELGNRAGLSTCLGSQGVILQRWGRLKEAMQLLKQQKAICEDLGDRKGLQLCLGNQGVILHALGQLEDAMEPLKQKEAICRDIGERAGLQQSLGYQGVILQGLGRLEEAMELHKQQEVICRDVGDRAWLSVSLGNQGLILKAWGRLEEAMELYKQQEAICRELGDPSGLATCLINQASQLGLAMSQPSPAMPLAGEAFRIATEHGLTALAGQIKGIRDQIVARM